MNSVSPAVSVVIPTYQRARVLPRSIGSVLAQTWEDFELLVVDDGSIDATSELLAGVEDPRVRTFHQENLGVCAARNRGLGEARGGWVTFLDSDDEADPDWLEALMAAAAGRDVGIVTAGARTDPGTGTGFEERLLPRPSRLFGRRIQATAGCLLARRDLLQEVGGYAESIHFAENSELTLRLVPACLNRGLDIAAVDRVLVTYHRNPGAWTSGDRAFADIRESAEYILEHHGKRLRTRAPTGYANYCSVAGINSLRLGDVSAGRQHLWAALRADPTRPRTYLRLALTLVPALAVRFWRRHEGPPTGTTP